MNIIENFKQIESNIKSTCQRTGRNPGDVTLLSVCKTYPSEIVQEAIDSGITLFGENRVQEASEKIPKLHGNFTFHLIGHLQSNKAKVAVKLFDLIHSIDKVSTAEKVNREAEKLGKVQRILVQVNTSSELSKSGVTPEETIHICSSILSLPHLSLEGLMTIGPLTEDKGAIRSSFQDLRLLREDISSNLSIPLPHLSMGMSGDYDIAIEEGATIIRVGSAIFGKRNYFV